MNPTAGQPIAGEVRDLLADLCLSDRETGGRPQLPPERVGLAREWLSRLLVDSRLLIAHIERLQQFYGARFRWPEPRWCRPERERVPIEPPAGFRHNQLLPEEKVQATAERGPAVLTDDELARLLLNPLALWDVADLINALLPEYWLGRMNEVGRQLMEEYGLEVAIPGLPADGSGRKRETSGRGRKRQRELALVRGRAGVEAGEAGCWNLLFNDDAARALARRIAEHAYGDPEKAFTLRLYRLPVEGQPDLVQAAVELSPAPTKNDLVLVINFREGGERTFTLEVPPEVKLDPEAEPREKTRSEPCAPLPAAAFEFQGGSEWRDEAWPPSLVLRPASPNRRNPGELSGSTIAIKRDNMDWQQLLQALQRCVQAGQITTYGECSQWAYGHRRGAPSIVAMLNVIASRGNHLWSNRVVQDDGGIADPPNQGYGQRAQLQAEGVPFDGQGRVDLALGPPVVLH